MKEDALSSIIIQLNELVLKCGALMCDNGAMEKAKKLYGFSLLKIPSDKYKSGFYYAVRYRDTENGKYFPTKKSTNTDNETQAIAFAIENRERIIKDYNAHKEKLHKKIDGKAFYRMLEEYYTTDSKYLKDDYNNNKRKIVKMNRTSNIGFIKNYLIPYLKENKINSIQEVNRSVYSNLKTYLQDVKNKRGENLSTKTINNYLTAFNRILQYHERHEIIQKLPYYKGTGIIKISKQEKANNNKPRILPINILKGILETTVISENKKENTLLYYTLALIGLTTGMRDSEIGRIKVSDIVYVKDDNYFYVKDDNYFYVKAYNHKTEYYNVEETEEYRKIPLHPFVVEALKTYIKEKDIKDKESYLFGKPKLNEDTKMIDGFLHNRYTHKAIMFLYKQIKMKEIIMEVGIGNESKKVEELLDKNIEKEMNEKHIRFYSLRHTFNTMCVLHRYNDTDITRSDDLISYFMGQDSGDKMRANYTQINRTDKHTFYNRYGKFVIEVLNKFVFTNEKENEEIKNYAEKFVDKKWEEEKELLDKEGKMDIETVVNNILNPLIKTLDTKVIDGDDFFTTE